jgi:hypothetical protein
MLPHPGGAEGGGEGPVTDPGYAYLAQFMMAYCHKVDDSFRGIRSEMSQLRAEIQPAAGITVAATLQALATVPAPMPPLLPSPPPAVFHQISEHTTRQPSLVPRLANLRQDPVLLRQANQLVDSLDY